MSSDSRLKRLGLDHLKDSPKELQEALNKLDKENEKGALLSTLSQLEDLKKSGITIEEQISIDAEIKDLREQIKYIDNRNIDDSAK